MQGVKGEAAVASSSPTAMAAATSVGMGALVLGSQVHLGHEWSCRASACRWNEFGRGGTQILQGVVNAMEHAARLVWTIPLPFQSRGDSCSFELLPSDC